MGKAHIILIIICLAGFIREFFWIEKSKEIQQITTIKDRVSSSLDKAKNLLINSNKDGVLNSFFANQNIEYDKIGNTADDKSLFSELILVKKDLRSTLPTKKRFSFTDKNIFKDLKDPNKASLLIKSNQIWIVTPILLENEVEGYALGAFNFKNAPAVITNWQKSIFAFLNIDNEEKSKIQSKLINSDSFNININGKNFFFGTDILRKHQLIIASGIVKRPFYLLISFQIAIGYLFFAILERIKYLLQNKNRLKRSKSKNINFSESFENILPQIEQINTQPLEIDISDVVIQLNDPPEKKNSKDKLSYQENSNFTANFLHLPFDETWKTKRNKTISNARSRIFTSEVQDLISDLTEKESDEPNWENLKNIAKNKTESLWNISVENAYSKGNSKQQIETLLECLMADLSCNALAVMHFKPSIATYQVTLSLGLNSKDIETFCLIEKDDSIKSQENQFIATEIKKDNPKFSALSKRLSDETFYKTEGILTMPMHKHGFYGYLVAFYQDKKSFHNSKELDRNEVSKKLYDCTPALKKFHKKDNIISLDRLPQEIISMIKHITNQGKDEAKVIHVKFKKPFKESDFKSLQKSLDPVLLKQEKILYQTPFELIFILKGTKLETIKTHLQLFDQVKEFYLKKFPSNGKNFFNYL